jgi:hypothetical protein
MRPSAEGRILPDGSSGQFLDFGRGPDGFVRAAILL